MVAFKRVLGLQMRGVEAGGAAGPRKGRSAGAVEAGWCRRGPRSSASPGLRGARKAARHAALPHHSRRF